MRPWYWRGWLLLVLLACVAAFADEAPETVYEIRMDARFDPEDGMIRGTQHLRWHNTASVPVEELQLHLYLNAFASNRSTFMTESGGEMRGARLPEDAWGWTEVESIRLPGAPSSRDEGIAEPDDTLRLPEGLDLKASEEFLTPDDHNPDDHTVVRYRLPEPLPPGEWVDVAIDFSSQLPGVFARTGVEGDYVLAGQWFPKVGVFEDAGVRGRAEAGWNTHQFHADSEFYADFGSYDVSLTLPARYQGKVGATGRLVEEALEGDDLRVRFVQDGVHDFAWTADPRYVVVTDLFDPERDVPVELAERIAGYLGVDVDQLALGPVKITLLLQPEHRSQAGRYIESAKAALAGYGLRLGAYPWDTMTLVDPARAAYGSGGMEYPTFITLGTHPLLQVPGFRGVMAPEVVTIHELGHNFWQGAIANNEFEEAWIDEGINSYYDMIVLEEDVRVPLMSLFGLVMWSSESNHSSIAGGRYRDPVVQPAWEYYSGGAYGRNSYPRPAMTLKHLENLLGREVFYPAMRRFFQEWRFRHPSTEDFERTIEEVSGLDLSWFFEQALHSTRALDYSIRSVRSVKLKDPEGFFWMEGERTLVGDDEETDEETEEEVEGEPEEEEDEQLEEMAEQTGEDPADGDDVYRTTVTAFREGEFRHPVVVELVFEDGSVQRHEWDGETRWTRWKLEGTSRLVSAEVDPDHLMVLDVNRLNNSRRVEPRRAPRMKLMTHLLFWIQNLLELTSVLG